jgi:uncharacterized protein YjiS (DUF1127 family)
MSYIPLHNPMHNRFAEGFVESYSWGDTVDALSSRILLSRFGGEFDAGTIEREARAARDAAIGAALSTGWAALRNAVSTFAAALHPLRARLEARRERRHAAKELCALDDRTLAELGLRRAEIPFVVARPVRQRDQRRIAPEPTRAAENDNPSHREQDLDISPLYFVK